MLQLHHESSQALENLRATGEFPPAWRTMAELEAQTNKALKRFLEERYNVSQKLGGISLMIELLDRIVRTEDQESLDGDTLSESEKLEVVQALDRQNHLLQLYPRYATMLLGMLEDVATREHRPLRILELASGSGGLAIAIAEEAQRKKLDVSVTGSDVVQKYVDEGNRQAAEKKLPLNFQLLNAFELIEFPEGAFDITIMAHSLHHFTPGQLAVIIAQAAKHTKTAFIGIDGHRSIMMAGGIPLVALLQAIPAFIADGFTSARKFYTEKELAMIAEIVTGRSDHTLTIDWPVNIITIRCYGIN